MDNIGILSTFIPVILPIAFGYLFNQTKIFNESEIGTLRKFIIKVSVPFLIFKNLFKADVNSLSQIFPSVLSFFILTGLFVASAFLFSKYFPGYFKSDNRGQNAFLFSTIIGNYAFLGWGVIHSFYGEQAFTRAVFFTMFFWPVFLFWGFFLLYLRIDKDASEKKTNIIPIIFRKAIVPITAAVLGILLNISTLNIPETLMGFIERFAALTIPMILFTIGLNFKIKMNTSRLKVALTASFFRLFLGFFLGIISILIVKLIFPIDILTMKVVLMESIMPTAAMSVFFIDFTDIDKELLSGTITLSTILSLLSIPFWFYIIEKFI